MRAIRTLVALSVVFLVTTAFHGCEDWMWRWDRIKGNGEIVDRWYPVTQPFTRCSIGIGEANCRFVVRSDSMGIRIVGDENLLDRIEVRVTKKGKLRIRANQWLEPTGKMQVTVYMPGPLEEISIGGAVDIVDSVPLAGKRVKVEVAGAAEGTALVQAERVDVDLAGSGEIALTGSARKLSVGIAGSGEVDAAALSVDSCCIDIAGAGDCRVFVTDYLKVAVAGSGDVCYYGNPRKIKQSILGSGDVQPCPKEP